MELKSGKDATMGNNQGKHESHTPLGRLIEQVSHAAPQATDSSLWERLDMERVARRVIQVARIATAEHAMQRVERAVRLRDEAKNRPATA
jgi:hypothetical protein